MNPYNEALEVLLDIITTTAHEHDRTTGDVLIDLGIIQAGREEDADRAEEEQGQ